MEAPLTPQGVAQSETSAPGHGSEISTAELRAALNRRVGEVLPAITAGLCMLYTVFTVAHLLVLPKSTAPLLAAVAMGTALIFLGLLILMRTWRYSHEWAHPLAACLSMLVLINGLLHIYLSAEPRQTTNLILLIIAVGILFLSTTWFTAIVVISLLGWGFLAWLSPPSSEWLHFGLALLSSTVLSTIVHLVRVRTQRQTEWLRIQDARRKAELETILRVTEEAQRSLATSMAVGQRITSILDLDVLLNQVAELIQVRFRCHFVGIFLLDESGEFVVARAGTGEVGRIITEQGLRLKLGDESVIGWVAAHRRPACLDDVLEDARYLRHAALPDTRSELALPLEMGARLLGVLDMESEQPGAFHEDDVPVLQMLADQVAIAIHNASLYESEKTRRCLTENLYEVGRALSGTLNMNDVFNLILEHLAEIVPYDRASVLLRDGNDLHLVASRGFPIGWEDIQITIKEGDVFDEIYRTQKPLAVADVMQRPDWQSIDGLPQARAWLGVPLIRAYEVLGMISLTRESPRAYHVDEITLAATFAGQAAIALHNARLFEQVTRFTQDLENLVQQRTEALQTAYDQLERLDRTKSDFISIASHELRTPLTLLKGYSQMLLDDPDIQSNEQHHYQIKGILAGADRLHEIVESMIDVAKIDSRDLQLYPVPIALPVLIRSVCEGLKKAMADRQLTLLEDFREKLPPVEADLDAMRKVFTNLVINAIKYTPDGGQITILGRALTAGESDIPGGGLEIVVSDTGIGVAPEARELIFVKFYQTGEVSLHSTGKTKFKGGGPGLGLAITKGIIEAHGGRIWVESPGHNEKTCPGSHFHVVLPLRQHADKSG
jgi:signal transduction histidine kinase/putative methionine-R-sulfoxide reductase with GAF domain